MFGPKNAFERQVYLSDSGGNPNPYYSEPLGDIGRSSKVLYISALLESFTGSNTRVDVILQHSNDGKNWADAETVINDATQAADENVYRVDASSVDFAPIARLALHVFDSGTTSQQSVVARISVSGKPF